MNVKRHKFQHRLMTLMKGIRRHVNKNSWKYKKYMLKRQQYKLQRTQAKVRHQIGEVRREIKLNGNQSTQPSLQEGALKPPNGLHSSNYIMHLLTKYLRAERRKRTKTLTSRRWRSTPLSTCPPCCSGMAPQSASC